MKTARITLVLVLAYLIGCNVTMTEQRAVEILGYDPEQRMALALRIVGAVQPSLGSKVRERFPEATSEQLAGLRISPNRMAGQEFKDGKAEPFDLIDVRCTITLESTDPTSQPILDYCEEFVESEFERQQSGGSDA